MHPLAQQIGRFIGDESADSFEELALALFEYQFTRNEPYRRLCTSLGKTPHTVSAWSEIPAVPASAFKRFDLTCRPTEDCPVVFHSSGTTAQEASRHWMDRDALKLYEISVREGYRKAIGGPEEILALMPTPQEAPHSSLSHMLGTLGATQWFWSDPQELSEALGMLCSGNEPGNVGSPFLRGEGGRRDRGSPITLFGTAFYFLGYFDWVTDRIALPEGSIIIETGGYKGRTREAPRDELYSLFTSHLGVPTDRCYGEYGMCEMASQFYSRGPDGAFSGPRWARTRAIDPVTGEDAPSGEPGLLRHYDLANFNSVQVIQTQDRGVIHEDGSFTLLGRAPQAEVRGCSLTAEDLWSATK